MSESKHTPETALALARVAIFDRGIGWQADATATLKALAAEVERLREENDRLRAKLGNSPEPCAYCALPADKLLDCQHGFPGCPKADDMMLCGHFGAAMDVAELRADLAAMTADRDSWADQAEQRVADWDAERRKVEALREALAAIAEGCSFPADDVQRAVRDRARAALASTEGGA